MTKRTEFPPLPPPAGSDGRVDRRLLFKGGVAAAGVALLEGCRRRETVYFEQALESAPMAGAAIWRHGVCQQCSAGCWIDVRLVDSDAKKIEGNVTGPVNRGGVCALGQSSLQELYNPDRVTTPLRRSGERGSGSFEPISWEEALIEVAQSLEQALGSAARGARPIAAAIAPDHGPLGVLWRRFLQALGAPPPHLVQSFEIEVERAAAKIVLGVDDLPVYDLAGSDYILSLGAAFVDRWRSPVHGAWALAQQRASRSGRRGKLVQAEPRQSLTAAAADEWLPLRPGTEGVLARALGGLLAAEADEGLRAQVEGLFPQAAPSPADAEQICDLRAGTVERLAAELRAAETPLVVVGGTAASSAAGLGACVAGLSLDLLLGAVGREGGVFAPVHLDLNIDEGGAGTAEALPAATSFSALLSRWQSEPTAIELLFVGDADPVHQAPAGWQLEAKLAQVPSIVALSSFLDDTTLHADLVLPVQTDLERFAAVAPSPSLGYPVLGLAEPALEALGEARHPGDVLLALATTVRESLPNEPAAEIPWESFRAFVEAGIEGNLAALPGGAGSSTRRFLNQALESGGIAGAVGERTAPPGALADGAAVADPVAMAPEPAASGSYSLIPFESVKSGNGRAANRPWMQELPDPLATVMWNPWVEVAERDAHENELATGDLVRLTSESGAIELPVFVSPATRPGCVGVPLGFGHRDYGRYAQGRGANVLDLLAGTPLVAGTGAPALVGTMVRVDLVARPSRRQQVPIYGRGLRQEEHIPRGWAPHEPVQLGGREGAAPEGATSDRTTSDRTTEGSDR